jgi:hypothetical protein
MYHCKIGAAFPHERGEQNLVRDGNATSVELRIPAVYILRHHVGVKMMLKD